MASTDYIDVHIIVHPFQDRSESLDKLLKQLEDEPVKVHLIEGTPYIVGEGRYLGYLAGTSEYKAYLDDDDEIVPGIFTKILDTMNADKSLAGCCTREQDADSGKVAKFINKYYEMYHCFHIHHITTYRISAIRKHLETIRELPETAEHCLAALVLLDKGLIQHIPEVGYIYRRHKQGISSNGIIHHTVSDEVYKRLNEAVIAAGKKSTIPGQCTLDIKDI